MDDEGSNVTDKRKEKHKGKVRHRFFLNPYEDAAFTRCPRCDNKTNIRKFPLVVHVEPQQIVLLNKICRYCTPCDLIIARQSELEALMVACLEHINPNVIGNEYLTMGVMEREDWKAANKGTINTKETLDRIYVFKEVLDFTRTPPGWYPPKEK